MNINNKRFLFIGGAGLIGSHTVDLILKENIKEVLIFDNFCRGKLTNLKNALKDKRVKIFDIGGDITQFDQLDNAMKGIDGVFHFAALWLLHCWDYPKSAFEVNIKGTLNVVESIIKNNVKRLVYSSSASVYGDGKQSYDFINVKDCALANILAMKSNFSDQFYNIGTGIKTSILELTQKILKISNKNLKIKFKKSGQTFVTNRIGCPKKSLNELKFKAKISLDEGLSEIIKYLSEV